MKKGKEPGRAVRHTSIGSPLRGEVANTGDKTEVLGKAREDVLQVQEGGPRNM